jgi:hypothetical protein
MKCVLIDTETKFGPSVSPNGPDVLRRLLEEFEELVRSQGAPVDNQLGAPLDRETIVEMLAPIGLTPPEELLAWFGWHNGLTAPPGGRLRGDALSPCIIPSTLEQAVERYYTEADDDHEEGRWDAAPGWLFLDATQDGLAVFCGDDPAVAPLVRSADDESPLWAEESSQQVVSLCTAVSYWIRSVELGVHRWNRSTGQWDYNYDAASPLLLRTSLVF